MPHVAHLDADCFYVSTERVRHPACRYPNPTIRSPPHDAIRAP